MKGLLLFIKDLNQLYIFRETSFTSLRLELYDSLKSIIGVDRKNASYFSKLIALGLAGAIVSVAGNPFDLLKTIMMAYEGSE